MTWGDAGKAAGFAFVVLALNLMLTVAVVAAWSTAFAPGRDAAFYNALATKIGSWSGPTGGALLMFAVGRWIAARRPGRNPHLFMLAVWAAYAILDSGTGLAMASAADVLTPLLLGSFTLALAGGQAGAYLARRRS